MFKKIIFTLLLLFITGLLYVLVIPIPYDKDRTRDPLPNLKLYTPEPISSRKHELDSNIDNPPDITNPVISR